MNLMQRLRQSRQQRMQQIMHFMHLFSPAFMLSIFGLLWVNAFFIAMFQFTIAVAAATWCFSYGTDH